jgi:redox-sensitive bicupin YhaK (pirin superfamily)
MPISNRLPGHLHDLGGGFFVRRSLPAAARRSVGPFIFFDHFGPVTLPAGFNGDVRPHPHIGLETVTYLFEGAMMHRDSIGAVQRIEPGAINWMTAGSGIVHSERTPDDLRSQVRSLHGLQLWVALPLDQEEAAPAFTHTPSAAIPEWRAPGVLVRVLVGSASFAGEALCSPVPALAPVLYLDIQLDAGASLVLPDAPERALYLLDGDAQVDGDNLEPQVLSVVDGHSVLSSVNGARCALIGGAPLDGHRSIWWNFVSSRKDRLEQAGADWTAGRFAVVPGETELMPLPPTRPA